MGPARSFLATVAFVLCVLSAPTCAADDVRALFTFGYLRMTATGVDSQNLAAGLHATIRYYNKHNLVPGVRFRLNATFIDCDTDEACRNLTPENVAIRDAFIARMPEYSAVIKPNHILAPTIIDAAKRLGNIPVLSPDDMRSSSYAPGAEHVINFNQNWARQTDHLFTYMQQSARCAHSGIFHGRLGAGLEREYDYQVSDIRRIFAEGDYPEPVALDVTDVSDEVFRDFFLGDITRRRCFFALGTHWLMRSTIQRLATFPEFDASLIRFYGTALTIGDEFTLGPQYNGSLLFNNVYFSHWLPVNNAPWLDEALAEWKEHVQYYSAVGISPPAVGNATTTTPAPMAAADRRALEKDIGIQLDTERLATYVTSTVRQGYMMMRLLLEMMRGAVGRAPVLADGPLPIPWSGIVDAFYTEGVRFDGYRFNHLIRECPPFPAKQLCFCNTIASSAYMYKVNNTTGRINGVYDNVATGERDIAVVNFPDACGYNLSSWSYPITAIAMFPTSLTGNNNRDDVSWNQRDELLLSSYQLFTAVFGVMTRETNYAKTPPTRALSFTATSVDSEIVNTNLYSARIQALIDTAKPFVIYGTIIGKLENTGDVLTLSPNLLDIATEDPPLTPHSQWKWNMVQLQPVVADYIHALTNYYSVYEARFTSIHAIATTQREAELISMSFATWGYNLPYSTVEVSSDPIRWSSLVAKWLTDSGSYNPFVLAATTANNNSVLESAAMIAGSINRGTLAIACSIVMSDRVKDVTTMMGAGGTAGNSGAGGGDIIFGAFRSEWWIPSAYVGVPTELRKYVPVPRYHLAMLLMDFSRQLYSQVYFDYKTTAAQVLYRMSVVSAADTAFGPFYNTTCTDRQIATNARDRRCQCTKGTRTIFIHSMRNFKDGVPSLRTEQFSWTMTTCGVQYRPYIAPPVAASAGLSSGAVAGIAVGCVALVGVLAALAVLNACFSGRDNRSAPKDASRPFTVVFTDIQSSTSLWARAPTAMSEAVDQHHRVMRKALRHNNGYEVKTVGDSFMVAFKKVEDAVNFTMDAQVSLHEDSWSSEIDATYVELLMEAQIEATESAAKTLDQGNMPDTNGGKNGVNHFASASETGSLSLPSRAMRGTSQYDPSFSSFTVRSVRRLSIPRAMSVNNVTDDSSQGHVGAGPGMRPAEADTHSSGHDLKDIVTDKVGKGTVWHGLRVRMGIHCGMGDIRKDPISLGYDYYGTVVNTAARVEGVGHGGQTLITQEVLDSLGMNFLRHAGVMLIALGPQPLRGLDEPIRLFQIVPEVLKGRRFPALRLHIEKETDDGTTDTTTVTGTGTGTGTTLSDAPENIVARLCSSKQYAMVSADDVLDRYNYFVTTFGPTNDKYKLSILTKLSESWGFDKSLLRAADAGTGRTRLTVGLIGKITKAYNSARTVHVNRNRRRQGDAGSLNGSVSGGSVSTTRSSHIQQQQHNAYVASIDSRSHTHTVTSIIPQAAAYDVMNTSYQSHLNTNSNGQKATTPSTSVSK